MSLSTSNPELPNMGAQPANGPGTGGPSGAAELFGDVRRFSIWRSIDDQTRSLNMNNVIVGDVLYIYIYILIYCL